MTALREFIRRYQLRLFFACWLLIQFLQAGYSELMDDEAYYWIYSKFIAWGYFDHPPMIAILIKAGYAIFHNEFGVRLFICLMNTGTLVMIHRLLTRNNNGLFYIIAISMAVLQIGGIIAVPDTPLAFFTAMFFLAYRNFLQKENIRAGFLLGVVMALLLYSKYHGILIILLTFASNPRIAKRPPAWIAVFTGVALFFPHLYWQYQHDFPSVRFHLFERNATRYKFSFTVEYLLGQVLLAGPIAGFLLIWAAFKVKMSGLLERALKFSLVGFYAFFLVNTLKGRVEANWTIPVFIPLIILSHQYLTDRPRLFPLLRILAGITFVIVVGVRIFLMADVDRPAWLKKDEFHRNHEWANAVHSRAGNLPVVFINSYQRASKYWFYSGVESMSLNTVTYRRNNYNFWPVEPHLAGHRVMLLSPYNYTYYQDTLKTVLGNTGTRMVDEFYSLSRLGLSLREPIEIRDGRTAPNIVAADAVAETWSAAAASGFGKKPILLYIFKDDDIAGVYPLPLSPAQLRTAPKTFTISGIHLAPGKYIGRLSIISAAGTDGSLNSTSIVVTIY